MLILDAKPQRRGGIFLKMLLKKRSQRLGVFATKIENLRYAGE
jgi:hypothetical protein